MGVFQKLFSTKKNNDLENLQSMDFVRCLEVVRIWNVQATYDPDIDINYPKLQAAFDSFVTCPYCSSHYYFSECVSLNGSSLAVQCPSCHTVPSDGSEEYEVA